MQKVIPDSCCQFEIPYELIRDHPTPTDISKNISKELVDVFLKTCTPIEKALFGRDKPLKGPDKLWIDPKDRCNDEKVKFTPLKTDCLQALTHQGILEIGKKFEAKIEERHSMKIAKAVKEAENFASFEANLKLKFHVDYITKNLNQEWQNKIDDLVKKHEYDKNFLIESFQDSREIMRQLMAQKIQDKENPTRLIEKAVNDTKELMKTQCNEAINNELALQTANFNEAMHKTLKNLEINDKNKLDKMRNECLKAMDVQSSLFNCKQMTELMHVMAMEKQSFRIKLSAIKKQHDLEMKEMREELTIQSIKNKSLTGLWNEFLIDIQQLQIEKFTDYEKKIYQEINYIENQLTEVSEVDINAKSKESLESEQSQLIIIQENVNYYCSGTNLDWISGNVVNCQQKAMNKANIDVSWQKSANDVELNYENKFSNYIFKPPNSEFLETSDQTSNTAKIIVDVVRNKNDEKTLENNEMNGIHGINSKMSKISDYFDPKKSNELLMAPKTNSVLIKDSIDALTKRVSILSEPVEQNQLIQAVDSFEILSRKPQLSNTFRKSISAVVQTNEAKGTNYKKMSDKDWDNIEALVDSKKQRDSIVQFDNEHATFVDLVSPSEHSTQRSRTSSILKQSSVQVESPKTLEDELKPIHDKCAEALKQLRVVSLLNLLSQDPDIQKQVEQHQ
ncbi:unnamed protein product [Diamesa serratosioi]